MTKTNWIEFEGRYKLVEEIMYSPIKVICDFAIVSPVAKFSSLCGFGRPTILNRHIWVMNWLTDQSQHYLDHNRLMVYEHPDQLQQPSLVSLVQSHLSC